MSRSDPVVSGSGSDDRAVVFVNNELLRFAVTSATDVSTDYLRQYRDDLSNVLIETLAEQQLDQFVVEFHDSERGREALLVFEIDYDGNSELVEAPVGTVESAIPTVDQSQDVVLLAWPVVDGSNEFERIDQPGDEIGSFGADVIEVTIRMISP